MSWSAASVFGVLAAVPLVILCRRVQRWRTDRPKPVEDLGVSPVHVKPLR